jgi:hypothetical protein
LALVQSPTPEASVTGHGLEAEEVEEAEEEEDVEEVDFC